MTTFAKRTEHNDHEGETWHFYIPIEGNEKELSVLDQGVSILDQDIDAHYELDLAPISERDVDVLVAHADVWYMANHNKLSGVLTLPDRFVDDMGETDSDPLYKGEIREYMVKEPSDG